MNYLTIMFLQETAATAQGIGGGGSMSFIIMMVAIFAVMWLFMLSPQQKRQ